MLKHIWLKSVGLLSLTLTTMGAASAATLTVNTTADTEDGACSTEQCSLREAITAANQQTGADTIAFNIPTSDSGYSDGVWTIEVPRQLPEVLDNQTTIDGATQTRWAGNSNPTGPEIALNGAPSSSLINCGIEIRAAECVVNGLSIGRFLSGINLVGTNSRHNVITGCYVGIDAKGQWSISNDRGIALFNGASSNRIGGLTLAERNIISGNNMAGVWAMGEPPATYADNNEIIGNYIGTDVVGIKPVPNGVGVFWSGRNSRIGGTTPGAGNVITGNNWGISITNPFATGNLVQGNLLGIGADGVTLIGNGRFGVTIQNGASGNIIGGVGNGEANSIVYGAEAQVAVIASTRTPGFFADSAGNTIRGNSIRAGISPAIALVRAFPQGSAAENDALDADTGPNNLQNFPVLDLFSINNRGVLGRVSLHSNPNSTFDIDLYQSTSTGARGDGIKYLGTREVTTDANGNAMTVVSLGADVAANLSFGTLVSATATNRSTGDTSEFCPSTVIQPATEGELLLSVSNFSVLEGNNGTTDAQFVVNLSGLSTNTISVDYATSDGSAAATDDYQARAGTLIFMPGETQKVVNVPVNGDALSETDETFVLRLANPVNVALANSEATATIVNDDSIPFITISNVNLFEGHDGITHANFSVTLSARSGLPVSAQYATVDNTASAADDYQSTSGTVTFAPGEVAQTISVAVRGDVLVEANEVFLVRLSNPVNVVIDRAEGIGTIINDDVATPTPTVPTPTPTIPTPTPTVPPADTTAPVVAFTSPRASVITNQWPRVTGTVSEASRLTLTIQREADGKYFSGRNWSVTRVLLPLVQTGLNWSLSSAYVPTGINLRDGKYNVSVEATDVAGNRADAYVQVWLDQNAPSVSFTTLRPNSTLMNLPLVGGRAVDPVGGTGTSRVALFLRRLEDGRYWSGKNWSTQPIELTTQLNGNTWVRNNNLPFGFNLRPALYRLTAIAIDRAGNRGISEITMRVVNSATVSS
jgi:CSLREA domain-containing protein